jgi:ferredoxin
MKGVGEAKSNTKKKHAPILNIDYSLCQGCGGCSDMYPQFFELRGERAWVMNADKFKAEDHPGILHVCPYYAIVLE